MVFWIGLALAVVGIAASLRWMVVTPGSSWSGPLAPLGVEERALAGRLRDHVQAIASREHNQNHPAAYESAATYIEEALAKAGYTVRRQPIETAKGLARNIEVEIPGSAPETGIVIVGAHYDSVFGAPGANDNGSGVAAVLELARLFQSWKPARTWRLALFANEEPPYFRSELMGSHAYAKRSKAHGERIVAMYSLETIGYYSEAPRSQHYPFPLGSFYPDRGNFLAFVANLGSRDLLHRTIRAFRAHAEFPSEGVAAPAFIPGLDWSDHWAFWREGWPAVMITDTAPYRYPYYHTAHDTPDKVDYERLARVVRGLEATFRALDASG
jgi:Zn-dependent M28 family amino/carboxypeptidase